jgi:hypothetical protein
MLPNSTRRHLRRKSQSHAPAHVLMRLYPIDKSLVCLQSERRTSIFDKSDFFPSLSPSWTNFQYGDNHLNYQAWKWSWLKGYVLHSLTDEVSISISNVNLLTNHLTLSNWNKLFQSESRTIFSQQVLLLAMPHPDWLI